MARGFPALWLGVSPRGQGDYDVSFTLGAPAADAPDALHRALATWAELGQHGAFARGNATLPGPVSLAADVEQAGPDAYRCVLHAPSMDTKAFQLLRNMAGRLLLEGIDVRTVAVSERGVPGELLRIPAPTEENEGNVYPPMSPELPFRVEFEDSDWGKLRRFLVELRFPVQREHVEALQRSVRPWMQALEGGAYALPIGLPTEVYSVGGPTTQFDENTIETTVVCFKASEMAWNTLANCVAASALGGSISRVLVD